MKKLYAKTTALLLLSGLLTTSTAYAKNLIAYFTVPENYALTEVDGVSGASLIIKDGKGLGASEYLAKEVQKNAGGELFRIETVQTYPTTHQPLLDFAQEEQRKGIKPALKAKPNLDGVDTVFLVYPIWWYQLPMPLISFLEKNDLSGKTVVPIAAHGGSRLSGTDGEIKRLQPKAVVKNGFEAYLYKTTRADERIEKRLATFLKDEGYTN